MSTPLALLTKACARIRIRPTPLINKAYELAHLGRFTHSYDSHDSGIPGNSRPGLQVGSASNYHRGKGFGRYLRNEHARFDEIVVGAVEFISGPQKKRHRSDPEI